MGEKQHFKQWLENFWFYHKIHLLIALAVIAVIGYSVDSYISSEKYDCSVVIYFHNTIGSSLEKSIKTELEKYCEDVDGNGKVNVEIVNCCFNEKRSDESEMIAKTSKLQSMLSIPEYMIFIVDDFGYEDMNGLLPDGFFEPDSVIKLNDTPFKELFTTTDGENRLDFNCYIAKRKTVGTAIEDKQDTEKYSQIADAFFDKMSMAYKGDAENAQ